MAAGAGGTEGGTVAIPYGARPDGETAAGARGDETAVLVAGRRGGTSRSDAARRCDGDRRPRILLACRARPAHIPRLPAGPRIPEVVLSVRSSALRWLAATHRVRDGDIFTSRLYPAEQSWTGRAAWWVQLPVHRLEALGAGAVHLVLQTSADRPAFHYLRLPAAVLRDNLAGLDLPGDGRMVSLFLSAEPGTRFRDERGAAQLDLSPFLVTAP